MSNLETKSFFHYKLAWMCKSQGVRGCSRVWWPELRILLHSFLLFCNWPKCRNVSLGLGPPSKNLMPLECGEICYTLQLERATVKLKTWWLDKVLQSATIRINPRNIISISCGILLGTGFRCGQNYPSGLNPQNILVNRKLSGNWKVIDVGFLEQRVWIIFFKHFQLTYFSRTFIRPTWVWIDGRHNMLCLCPKQS